MLTPRRVLVVLVSLFVATGGGPAVGQSVDLGGRFFGDYFYAASAPDAMEGALSYPVSVPDTAREGLHGFAYRRLYLTLDFQLSDRLKGRARLEANDGTSGPKGPVPFVKDLSLTWTYSGTHSATVGVTPPPAFGIAEDAWGYRSVEKTIMDRRGIADSRDFGLRLDGPLASDGAVRYAVMYANNSASRPETDAYKRIYGQVSATPTSQLTLVAGGDYTAHGDRRDQSLRFSAFAGYEGDRVRGGAEGYRSVTTWTNAPGVVELGTTVFGAVQVAEDWELFARFDRSRASRPAPGSTLGPDVAPDESLWIAGVAYRPHPNVEVLPNVWTRTSNRTSQADIVPRLTLDVSF